MAEQMSILAKALEKKARLAGEPPICTLLRPRRGWVWVQHDAIVDRIIERQRDGISCNSNKTNRTAHNRKISSWNSEEYRLALGKL